MDEQLHKMNTQTFTASDEPTRYRSPSTGISTFRRTDTVQVTLNGHLHLTDAYIEDGLPRLGAQLVEQRLNEALLKAMAAASEATDSDRERLDAAVAEITGKLRTDK